MKKKIGIFISIFFVIVLSLSFFFIGDKGEEHTVVLRKDGFYPPELTIQKGDVVTFSTNLDKMFWPASNLHPTHTVYSEFDPKEPIQIGDNWSFVFKEAGNWEFHDHLNSGYIGTIIVFDDKGERVNIDCDAAQLSDASKKQCWGEFIRSSTLERGVKTTLEDIQKLYADDPLFAGDCHIFTHLIGEEAYTLFANKELPELTPLVSLCGYGFFHGFIETLVFTTGSLNDA